MRPIIKNIYQYPSLTRIDSDTEGRKYLLPDGEKVPSVTTIISDGFDMSAINDWKEAVGQEFAEKYIAESAMIGEQLHNYLEEYIKTGEKLRVTPMANMLAQAVIKKEFPLISEVWGLECNLYYPDLYAGTSDLLCVYNNKPAICDYKNARKLKSDEHLFNYKAQLGAYALAHNELFGTKIEQGVIMMSTWGLYKCYVFEGKKFFSECHDAWMQYLEKFYR